MSEGKTVKNWTKTSVQNLVRHRTGRYYARTYSGGKESWKSLKTAVLEVAKVRLRELTAASRSLPKAEAARRKGKMTFADCRTLFLERVRAGYGMKGKRKAAVKLSESSIHYREQTVDALWESWPKLQTLNVSAVTEKDVEKWAEAFAADYSPTRFNNTLDTLRALFRIAEEAGARHGNPALGIHRVPVKKKNLALPTREQFGRFVESIRTNGAWCSRHCADLVSFLAFTGARRDEAAHVEWRDVDFSRGQIHLRVCKGDKGQDDRARYVPMVDDARRLLTRMREERPEEEASDLVLKVKEAQKAMDVAAKKDPDFPRITHHNLRDLFATTAIESGVDVPTVSRWLGHRDGGALLLQRYNHLRDEHSSTQAKKVSFAPIVEAANVLPFEKAGAV